jgi:hypothetical protein
VHSRFAKLSNDEWGIFAPLCAGPGDYVPIYSNNGKFQEVQVRKVIATYRTAKLCSIVPAKAGQRSQTHVRCAQCGESGHLILDLDDGKWKHLICCTEE